QIALVDYAFWAGDGTASGLLGLAYPALTSAYAGTDPTLNNVNRTRIEYTPLFTNMYQQGLFDSVFSLAIERGEGANKGNIAFGGLPPVRFVPSFASTPIEVVQLVPFDEAATEFSFYTINIDGFRFESGSVRPVNDLSFIVDSGTSLNYLPTVIARNVNALFDPPAQLVRNQGAFFVPCNATPPDFGIEIGGKVFWIDSADMINQQNIDLNTGYCVTGINDGGAGPYILGDVFLANVVAVFDVGAAQMRFAPRQNEQAVPV
ncbi:hypothetical protein LTS18_009323, partial [Coniosporium uncinatum]